MSALIGALRVTLAADTANFEAGMKRAQRATAASATAMQKSMGLIKSSVIGLTSALSVGLFTAAISSALKYAGSLTEVAETLGVTAKDLQEFRFAAGQVGVSQEELETGLQKLTISMGKAQLGSKAQADAFRAIGISIDDIKNKNAGEIFRMMAEKLQNVSDRSQRAAVEVALFGKAGAKLDNLLSGAEGSPDDLSRAAEKLGIVLSDEQIQNADRTADKLEALETVLKAQLSGFVADKAQAIFNLADALAKLAHYAVVALNSFGNFVSYAAKSGDMLSFLLSGGNPVNAAKLAAGIIGQSGGKSSITVKLPPARPVARSVRTGGADVGKFLATGGGGGSHKAAADHSAEEAARRAEQFDQEQRRAQIDILRAQQDLAADYIERTTIGIEILNAEKDAYDAELQYRVASKDITQAQADQLKAQYDKKDALERSALLAEEEAHRQEDVQNLTQHDFDRRKDILQAQDAIATTAAERRRIELDLLDIAYQQKKQALEYTIATSKDIAAVEDARRDLLNLNKTYANDRQGVMQNTQGPLEQYFSQVPKTADEANEAFQRLEVQGIDGAINSIIALTDGFQSFRDTALQAIKQVIAELIRMQLMKLAFQLFGAATGSPTAIGGGSTGFVGLDGIGSMPGFASGGSMILGGRGGTDRNVLSLNGLPIARVSRGEGLHVTPDASGMGGAFHFNVNVNGAMSDADARRTGMQIAAGFQSRIAQSRVKGMSA